MDYYTCSVIDRRVGDVGNIEADETGEVMTEFTDSLVSLEGTNDVTGRSVVVSSTTINTQLTFLQRFIVFVTFSARDAMLRRGLPSRGVRLSIRRPSVRLGVRHVCVFCRNE